MTAFNVSYLKIDARVPYYGWDFFHEQLDEKPSDDGHLIRKRSDDDGKIFTYIKGHRCSFYFPGQDYWGKIRAKLKFAVVEGSISSWRPIYHIGTGDNFPRVSEIEPQHYESSDPPTELDSPDHYELSGAKTFKQSDHARKAYVIIGFRAVGNGEGTILARSISMYDY